jgi:hypothetical protein
MALHLRLYLAILSWALKRRKRLFFLDEALFGMTFEKD